LPNAEHHAPAAPPAANDRIGLVGSFAELAATPFAGRINALCWPRHLPGDFGEVVSQVGDADDMVTLDEARLGALPVSAAGRLAVEALIADLQLLREHQRDPVLNCIRGYPRDDASGPVPTDVFSWHADSAPVPADTWLCTYHGSPSEGLRNEDAQRRVDDPATRAALLEQFGGDGDAFRDWLHENCYDLHYAARPGAQPYSFGHFNLWRIAVEYPGSPVLPCVHRAPATIPRAPRLLLIC
jgi:hypothetical protein